MKITNVKTYLAKEWRTFLFVVVETDEGICGIGEAGITGREKAMAGAVEHFAPQIIGLDPFNTEHIWQLLWRGGFYPAGQILSAAISAIDMALWDIKGKVLNVPVYKLLGGLARNKVHTYTHVHGNTSEEVVKNCVKSAEQGWKYLRWEFFSDEDGLIEPKKVIKRAVHEWRSIRDELGDDIELCFDAHTKLGVSDAIRFCNEVEAFRPFFIEDPIRSENPQAYRRLRAHTSVPVAAGEQFSNKWDFRELIEEQLIDQARFDICIGGGITEGKKIAAMCETHFIDVAVHNPVGPVSTAASLHFNLSIPNCSVMELPKRPGETMPEVFKSSFKWHDGDLYPSDEPGLGIELNLKELEKYPFEQTELPKCHKLDGSFNNW